MTGGVGAVFGLASIVGPLLGGYLTAITWRWCFIINVPIGVLSLVVLVLLTPRIPPSRKPSSSLIGKIEDLDPLGFVLIVPAVVCLLFALEWGGVMYAWNSGQIIALLVLFAVFSIAFVAAQAWRGEKATVPPRIFLQRTMLWSTVASVGIGSALVVFVYYLPIWFQAIQGKSPQSSGLSLLGLLISNVLSVITSGVATSKIGYYTPFLIFGSTLAIAGAALISTWQVDSSQGQWIGYQVNR